MPFVPASQTAQAELRYTWAGERVENVLYFQASATLSTTLMVDLADALEAWWRANLRAQQSTTVTLSEIFVTNLTTSTSPTHSLAVTSLNQGLENGIAKPNNVTAAISFRTNGRGRSSRGRNYVIGLTDNLVTGNTLNNTTMTAYTNAYQLLQGAGIFVPGLQWCVVSRISNGGPRVSALVQPILTAVFTNNVLDSQRRRLPGRGT